MTEAARTASARRTRSELAAALRLVVITDSDLAGPRGVVPTVAAALEGGCRVIQLRAKDESARAQVALGRELRALTRRHDALLFVNDRADIAIAVGADGVHLGPSDPPVLATRQAFPALLIGYSTDDPSEARDAVEDGADYIGCGAVFGTSSKEVGGEAIGLERLRAVVDAVQVPVVGIGGITPDLAHSVRDTGAAGSAVIASVMTAPDPRSVVQKFLNS